MSAHGPVVATGDMVEAPLQFRLRSGGSQSPDRALVICPKCDAPAFIRHSDRVTPKVKYLTCHCTNSGCGHVFELEMLFRHSLVEGNIERPDLDLPVCPRDKVRHILPPSRDGPGAADQMTMFSSG